MHFIEYGITLVCSNKHLNNKFIDSTILTKETIYIERISSEFGCLKILLIKASFAYLLKTFFLSSDFC